MTNSVVKVDGGGVVGLPSMPSEAHREEEQSPKILARRQYWCAATGLQ